jgi:hypothetical protein
MNREQIISILKIYPSPENLKKVISNSLGKAQSSHRFIIHSSEGGDAKHLPAEHYFKGFTLRLKNPNGVARNTLGLLESVENFDQHSGNLELVIAELDDETQISLWISNRQEIIGCFLHFLGSNPTP